MQADCLSFHQNGLECLDTQAVQSGCPVEQDGVILDDLLEDIPDLRSLPLHQLLGPLDGLDQSPLLQLPDDEWFVEFERHHHGQATLMHLQLGSDHDHRPAGIIDPFAQEVLAEPALLALQQIAE